jgi:hypothetical protein
MKMPFQLFDNSDIQGYWKLNADTPAIAIGRTMKIRDWWAGMRGNQQVNPERIASTDDEGLLKL